MAQGLALYTELNMTDNDLFLLKQRTIDYLIDKEFYSSDVEINVCFSEANQFSIIYGVDAITGIIGFGNTADGAFNDFTDNWESYSKHATKIPRITFSFLVKNPEG